MLSGRVRADELPDVARPTAQALPQRDPVADSPVGTPTSAELISEMARSVLEAGRLPLRLTEAALESQAQAIDGWVAGGAVPPVLVPGAVLLRTQSRFLVGMLRTVSGSGDRSRRDSGPPDAG